MQWCRLDGWVGVGWEGSVRNRVAEVLPLGRQPPGCRTSWPLGCLCAHRSPGVCLPALQVALAVRKAVTNAKRNLVTVPLSKTNSFPHRYEAEFKAAKVGPAPLCAALCCTLCPRDALFCGTAWWEGSKEAGAGAEPSCLLCSMPPAQVMLRPAAEGTGVIAGGAVRIVLELAGVKNGFGKQLGR